jgi:hypothetical protein
VDFLHLHGVALEVLAERGVIVRSDLGDSAFTVAWRAHRAALEGTGLSKRYFQEEVSSVIKGRDLQDVEEYLALTRIGRRTPLREEVRTAVWSLRERYDAELASRGQHDMVDLLRLARDEVRREPYTKWTGVAVDEVQDLPLVGLQLLHELAGRDKPDATASRRSTPEVSGWSRPGSTSMAGPSYCARTTGTPSRSLRRPAPRWQLTATTMST